MESHPLHSRYGNEVGTQFYFVNIRERDHYSDSGVLIWGGIIMNGQTELQSFDIYAVTNNRYSWQVIFPNMFLGAKGEGFIFWDDNARPVLIHAVEELL
ncbi:hypothetical protein AVEN_25023-1 [Araneus ventricosus]|uniref:Uncharacterized protein n=1 Tax=Araneus ventricosus TaxID=182803 RepID=A0A4Y2KXQ0_ARAVE|nr:hypothetical protein AVEN_25023-1 [Araneus ventricosus]